MDLSSPFIRFHLLEVNSFKREAVLTISLKVGPEELIIQVHILEHGKAIYIYTFFFFFAVIIKGK